MNLKVTEWINSLARQRWRWWWRWWWCFGSGQYMRALQWLPSKAKMQMKEKLIHKNSWKPLEWHSCDSPIFLCFFSFVCSFRGANFFLCSRQPLPLLLLLFCLLPCYNIVATRSSIENRAMTACVVIGARRLDSVSKFLLRMEKLGDRQPVRFDSVVCVFVCKCTVR